MRRLSSQRTTSEAARPHVRTQSGGRRGPTAQSRTTVCRLPEGEAYDRLQMISCDAARFHKYLMGVQRRWQCAPVHRELSLRLV
jgi:hypothetical protein